MVTSLFQHEQIETTLPKAREAARLAEKMITLSKRNNKHSYDKAGRFLLDKAMLPKLFTTFAQRYADRPGGYTRIHKYMNNPADNAPRAILELVDNPKDLRWALTSRAVGWEFLKHKLQSDTRENILQETPNSAQELVRSERTIDQFDKGGLLRPKTRWNLQKVLRYRDDSAALRLGNQANGYIVSRSAPSLAMSLTDSWNRINFCIHNARTLQMGASLILAVLHCPTL